MQTLLETSNPPSDYWINVYDFVCVCVCVYARARVAVKGERAKKKKKKNPHTKKNTIQQKQVQSVTSYF